MSEGADHTVFGGDAGINRQRQARAGGGEAVAISVALAAAQANAPCTALALNDVSTRGYLLHVGKDDDAGDRRRIES